MIRVFLFIGLALSFLPLKASQEPKRFKRALVIAGGGIAPGVGLGIIAGVQRQGWYPDVIITTCGASMAASLYNVFQNSQTSLAYAQSEAFYHLVRKVEVNTPSVIDIGKQFNSVMKGAGIPTFFDVNVLKFPEDISGTLPVSSFPTGDKQPKVIILAAKANFSKEHTGRPQTKQDLFTQVYFTDPSTAELLTGFKSPIRRLFPKSFMAEHTEVITDVGMEQATRASISDPFLINPGQIGEDYYFTGAVDLVPMELAHEVAEEIVVTFPSSLFYGFQETAMIKTFGFSQSKRALHAIQDREVKWIDISGIDDTKFDPYPRFLTVMNGIPDNIYDYGLGIQRQFDFGYERATEAMILQKDRVDVRSHLREPISPKLLERFHCKNAYAWIVPGHLLCTSDDQRGCNRQEAGHCIPIR